MFLEENEIKEILEKYHKKEATLPLLLYLQKKKGTIEREDLKNLSKILDISISKLKSLVSFYSILKEKRTGKYHFRICTNICCSMNGSEKLISLIKKELNIEEGEVTKDGLFSFEEVECLAGCGYGPIVMVNDRYYTKMTEENLLNLIKELKDKG